LEKNCDSKEPTVQPASDEIFNAAMKLSDDERLILAAKLMETVPDQPAGLSLDDAGLIEELRRRSTDRTGSVSWNQVRGDL
jgi:hypothetical protein